MLNYIRDYFEAEIKGVSFGLNLSSKYKLGHQGNYSIIGLRNSLISSDTHWLLGGG